MEDLKVSSDSRNLKSLMTKGGYAGQIKVTERNRWKYFPESESNNCFEYWHDKDEKSMISPNPYT